MFDNATRSFLVLVSFGGEEIRCKAANLFSPEIFIAVDSCWQGEHGDAFSANVLFGKYSFDRPYTLADLSMADLDTLHKSGTQNRESFPNSMPTTRGISSPPVPKSSSPIQGRD